MWLLNILSILLAVISIAVSKTAMKKARQANVQLWVNQHKFLSQANTSRMNYQEQKRHKANLEKLQWLIEKYGLEK